MADLLETIEIETATTSATSIVWMHGLGADGNDFVDIVPELRLPLDRGVRFVFPHAPMRPVTINNGYVMRAWYDIRDAGGVRREDAAGVRASQAAIEALVARERGRGIPAAAIVLAGFSQGGAMALHTGLRRGEMFALTWHDVDFSLGIIRVLHTKNGERREIPMSHTLRGTI